ncbi:MAG: restriction endonuclease subunit S [Bacillota bacterium]|nr:restriction endonuclease subunit S [Bacillota bacterium]
MREMKDSGVEWIGEIPKEWATRKIKFIASLAGRIGWQGLTSEEYSDEGAYLITGINFKNGKIDWNSCVHVPMSRWEEATQIQIKSGDLLITKDGTVGKVAIAEDVPYETSLNSGVLLIRNDYTCDTRFLFWMIQSEVFWKWFGIINSGNSTIIHLYQQDFYNFSFPFPDKSSQERIVDYLDAKCFQIDSIIEKQQAIIEKLKEYKLSVITEAVTKGLNPDVEMKDSGIRKLKQIPKNWDEIKITRMLDSNSNYPMGDGDHGLIKTDDYKEEGIPYIRVQNLGWGTELLLDNVIYISEEDHERIKSSELHPGDILFCKTGATIGKTGMIPENIPIANTTSHVGKITLDKKYNPRFVFYYLSSHIGYVQFWDIACLKSTRPELAIEETKAIKIAIPKDKTEQDAIVQFLDLKCKELDVTISSKEKVIEKLQEYKKSLIYEVVTGKKEV